ncbi:MAG TPA: adenosine deaminase [Mycobacteriales bacterium]|nr:adenosine deaminase [Mycobacteriales bacterium]
MGRQSSVTDADLLALPKAHLHLHLTGGMRHRTLIDLAARGAVTLPERLVEPEPEGMVLGWPRFQRLYDVARSVLRTPEDFDRLLLEVAVDEHAAGSRWLELQITPTGYAVRLGDVVTAVEVFCSAAAKAEAATGVGVRLIIAANRTRPAWEAELLARLAVRYAGEGVVGFGLSNDERRGLPEEFAKAFRIAREGGLVAMPHAGELLGPESVSRTVAALSPVRIGHGVRATEDPDVLRMLADRGIACEVCPTSNLAMGVYRDLAAVPLPQLEAAGVPVVLATDDPLLFGGSLVGQYASARDDHGYDRADLARLARTSVTHSLMPADLAARLHADIDAWERGSAGT